MKIDKDLILKLEKLTKLKLDDQERSNLMGELEKVIEMFDSIANAPTDGVDPMIHFSDINNTLREDVARAHGNTDNLVRLSKESKGNYFAVPKVIEQ